MFLSEIKFNVDVVVGYFRKFYFVEWVGFDDVNVCGKGMFDVVYIFCGL